MKIKEVCEYCTYLELVLTEEPCCSCSCIYVCDKSTKSNWELAKEFKYCDNCKHGVDGKACSKAETCTMDYNNWEGK